MKSSNVVGDLRICTKCKIPKPNTNEFYPFTRGKIQARCHRCCVEYQRAHRMNPEVAERQRTANRARAAACKDEARSYHRLRKYGISEEQYDEMLKNQNGVCAICKTPPRLDTRKKVLVIDHSHTTGAVRALLCDNCNRVLGLMNENIETLITMHDYLLKHEHTGVQS